MPDDVPPACDAINEHAWCQVRREERRISA